MKDFTLRGFWVSIAAIFALCSSLPILGEESEDIEEVTVTGSYIKRSSFDSPVPLSVIDRAEMEDLGAIGIEEVVQNLTYTSTSGIRAGLLGGTTGGGGIDLRGLGSGATLVLFNGRRNITTGGTGPAVNITILAPTIAIERMEIVKDGAGALYGSDAVAGVVNFITRNRFEGLEMSLFGQVDDDSHEQTNTEIQAIWGGAFDQGHFMMSVSYTDRKPLEHFFRDLPGARDGTVNGSAGASTNGKNFIAVNSSEQGPFGQPFGYGRYAGSRGVGDLDCDKLPGTIPNAFGTGWICGYDFAPFYPIEEEQQKLLYFTNVDWDWSDDTTLHFEFSYADTETSRTEAGFPFNVQPFIPKYNPGSVEDAARREALCAAAVGAPCGIVPIDLRYKGRWAFGLVEGLPGGIKAKNGRHYDRTRFVVSADGVIPGLDDWTWDAAFTYSEQNLNATNHDTIKDNVVDSLAGLGGITCDENDARNQEFARRGMIRPGSGCIWWNPFGNANFNQTGGVQHDPLLVNTDEVYQFMDGIIRTNIFTEVMYLDVVVTGPLVDIPSSGLPLQIALGVQYREEHEVWERDNVFRQFAFSFTEGDTESNLERDMYALFAELSVPLLENLEVQLALRFEDFGDGLDSTDPKIAVLWSPHEDINIRASFGTSFQMPSNDALNGRQLFLANISDGANGDYYVPIQVEGNPNLVPAEADVWNVGFSWKPTTVEWLEGFEVDFDWWSIDHTDIVVSESFSDILANELDAGTPDPRIIRDPISGLVQKINPARINAGGRDTSGIDATLSYNVETDGFGSFGIKTVISWYDQFELTTVDTVTGVETTIDGVGWTNSGRDLDSLPEYRINTTVSWSYDRHRTVAIFRYLPDLKHDGEGNSEISAAIGQAVKPPRSNFDESSDWRGNLGFFSNQAFFSSIVPVNANCPTGPSRTTPCKVDDHLTIDLQYTYRLPELGFQQEGSMLQAGIINVTDEDPPKVNDDPGFIPNLHDSRGRLYYLRYTMNLF